MIWGLLIKTGFEITKPVTLFNKIVRWRLPYDHAAILFEENGRLKVAEMKIFGGYTETDYEEWQKQYKRTIKQVELTCSIDEIRKHKGKTYDPSSTFWALPIYILTGKWVGRKHIADRKLFCFELLGLLQKQPEWWLYLPEFETCKK